VLARLRGLLPASGTAAPAALADPGATASIRAGMGPALMLAVIPADR
jgi:hypothetical protein